MSRWLQIAEQDDWQISKRDTSDNRDNSPTPAPNVASVTNVRVGEVAADEAGSPTKQFDDQFRHPMEPGPGATDDAWRKWREHLVHIFPMPTIRLFNQTPGSGKHYFLYKTPDIPP